MNKPILIDFLNQVLPPGAHIKELSYSRNEHLGKHDYDRRAIFDLYCVGKQGERFIVKMQKAEQKWFMDRSVYYASFPIQEQAKKGTWNYELKPVYTIEILDFIFDEDKNEPEKYLYRVKLSDIETNKIFYEKLSFVYLEIPKFKKNHEELGSRVEKWIYYLKHLTEMKGMPKEADRDKVFRQFFEQAELGALSEEEHNAYEESLKVYRDLKNVTDTAYDKGKVDGKKEGRVEGKIQGKIEGRMEGKLETARNLLKEGLSVDIIVRTTGLSENEVEELKNSG